MYTGETRVLIQAQLHLCPHKVHPNVRYNPLLQYRYCKQYPPHARLLGQHMRLSFASFTLQPPLQQTSPSPWPPAFPLPLHPPEEERGRVYTVYTGDTRMLIQAQLHLCPHKVHPNVRYNPLLQYRYCKQYPSHARLLTNLQRLSFATPLCNDPFNKPLHPPGLRPSPFLSDLRRRQGGVFKRYKRDFVYCEYERTLSVRVSTRPSPPNSTSLARGAIHTKG